MDSVVGGNPTRAEQQEIVAEVQDVEAAVETLMGNTSLVKQSTIGGTQKLVIADNVVVGSDQPCRSCLLHIPEGNTGDVHLTIADEAADVNDWLCPKGIPFPAPVDNCADLHFYGGTNGDLIYVLWRS